jgi:ABC-type phosphate transport system permease subunit
MLPAAPAGIGSAIFCSSFPPPTLRIAFKISIQPLAGVPSVAYGLPGILLLLNWTYETIRDLSETKTIIQVTHNHVQAQRLCKDGARLDRGRMIQNGGFSDLLECSREVDADPESSDRCPA